MHGLLGFTMGSVWRLRTSWECLNLLVRSYSSCGCSQICYVTLIFNRRKHTCSDNDKYSCFSLIHPHIFRQSNSSIYELYIHLIRFGTLPLINCAFFVSLLHLRHFPYQIRHESSFEIAKGYIPKKNRIHYSGPLMPPSGNIDEMLKEHEKQIQQAVRKAPLERNKIKNKHMHNGQKESLLHDTSNGR
ncbi:putative protein isoform X2 [Capsicum galapagoense]